MIEINLKGVDAIKERLKQLKINSMVKKSLLQSSLLLEREAKIRTPVDTGFLRNGYSIIDGEKQGGIVNRVEYGEVVEARQGFIQRTFEYSEGLIINIFNKNLQDLLQSI